MSKKYRNWYILDMSYYAMTYARGQWTLITQSPLQRRLCLRGRAHFGEEKLVPVTAKLAPSTRDGDVAARAARQSRSAFIRATLEQAVQKFVDRAAAF